MNSNLDKIFYEKVGEIIDKIPNPEKPNIEVLTAIEETLNYYENLKKSVRERKLNSFGKNIPESERNYN